MPDSDTSDIVDWGHLRELRDEIGPEDFADVVEVFLADTDDMVRQLSEADVGMLEARLHALKGSALNLGLTVLARVSSEAERAAADGDPHSLDVAQIVEAYRTARDALTGGLSQEAMT